MRYLLIAVGGGAGSLARYLTSVAVQSRYAGLFPLGTVTVNLVGSFLIGVLMTWFSERLELSPEWRYLFVVGFLGGFTTFSAFEWENFTAMRDGEYAIAFLNAVGSVVAGCGAVWLGAWVARR